MKIAIVVENGVVERIFTDSEEEQIEVEIVDVDSRHREYDEMIGMYNKIEEYCHTMREL
ncbi:MAG: hypothetical protein J6A25_07680 [Lachnospiraceae bacterium]|nr:hypothetical protein [Lachnospiraceae bacterium]MBO5425378.1 hypothetical protein [Lachnospiraceae bacterium]